MNSFSIVALFVCVALASSATVSPPNPLKQAFNKILNGKAGIEALCAPVCFGSCGVLEETCVDVEGFIDCATQIGTCQAGCAQLCGCLNKCPSDCAEDCASAGNSWGKAVCQSRVVGCIGFCQTSCPYDLYTNKIMESINKILAGLDSLLNSGDSSGSGGSGSSSM